MFIWTIIIFLLLILIMFAINKFLPNLVFPTDAVNSIFVCSSKCEIIELSNEKISIIKAGWEYYSKSSPLIIISHGNGHNLSEWYYQQLYKLAKNNHLPVISWDYLGYGHSTGVPDEISVNNIYDKLLRQLNHSFDKLILIGQSIGCGCTLDWTSKNKCAALILITPFTSIMKTKLPFSIPAVDMWSGGENKIRQIRCPILIIGAEKDTITPFDHSLSLHQNSKQSALISFDGNHNDIDWLQPVSKWIKRTKIKFDI